MIEYLATTIKGLEDVAYMELKELINSRCELVGGGRIKWYGTIRDAFLVNYLSRSIHRVIYLLIDLKFNDLKDIYSLFKSIKYTEYLSGEESFAVRSKRMGEHDFTSIDVSRVVGQAIIDSFLEETGLRLKVNLDNPDVIFRVYVSNDRVMGGIDTTGEDSLHKRNYRVYQHPASLKPTIAYSLIRLSDWRIDESLIDPMCGGGTISIEAALYGRNIPPGRLRKTGYGFTKLKFLDQNLFHELVNERFERNVDLRIYGSDVSAKHVNGAVKNAASAGVQDCIKFSVCDARRVDLSHDRIVANVPYGIRIDSPREVRRVFKGFVKNLLNHSWKKLVVLDGSGIFIEEARWELDLEEVRGIMYGSLKTQILIFKK